MAKSKITTVRVEFDVPANKMKAVAQQIKNIIKILEDKPIKKIKS